MKEREILGLRAVCSLLLIGHAPASALRRKCT
jgi:hypothetical protein